MEKNTSVVFVVGIMFASAVLGIVTYLGHEDNNRQKQVVEQCIQVGGEPQFYRGEFIGCPRG